MVSDKKKMKRPSPKMLGAGEAAKAGKILNKRRMKYEAFEKELFGSEGVNKRMKKPSSGK